MSFNLNKLVQPECGGSNPLVAAAQQISAHPGATSRLHPQVPSMNFAKEFMEQHKDDIRVVGQPGSSHGTLLPSFSSSSSSNMMSYHQPSMMQPQMIGRVQNLDNVIISGNSSISCKNIATAGDQLEAKFREDTKDTSKLDDVAFWQSLSQKYTGPATYDSTAKQGVETKLSDLKIDDDNLAEPQQIDLEDQDIEASLLGEVSGSPGTLEPSLEYTFDERNPLKDQFEDPFQEGLKKLEQGDIPSAVLLFEAAVQLKPEESEAWRYLGTTQALNENDKSAIKALLNCLKLNQDDQQARLAISVSLANEYKQQEACIHLIEWLMRHEKYKNAGASLEELRKFRQIDHNNYGANRCALNYVRGKLLEAARMSPNNPDPEVQNSLGVLFNMFREYGRAVDCFKAALSVKSDDSILWNRLGATLANGNRSTEAVVAYKKALEISPGFLRTRYNLAVSMVHLNLFEEASKQLVQILSMQAAGKGSKDALIRSRSVTSISIWNTLRTVATLNNRPDLYSIIEGRDLAKCKEIILNQGSGNGGASGSGGGGN